MKETLWIRVPQEDSDVSCCEECPKFEYENGKGICYEKDMEVEDSQEIDERCPYRPQKKRSKKK